ncbi:nuclear transport factor 2 family protein [Streptomyces sp. S3(2020)]|uniref:nuclear transport factor 2 family protein n=1 Tax=Streptomyces sp. S3(2020) TaxID=2732044 RepID=UPI001489542C|nr:nuclear transport factor 2 family protein [Streptomyces sp. S3(2020)]NNN29348.1 nuclear transport factor 2 family protein [Streptomyces sp. S3(2020)]
MVLREYMARMDGQDPEKALDLVEPGFRFLIALPAGQRGGTSREEFAAYIAGRQAVDRTHEIQRYAVDGDVETAYGFVVEKGVTTGAFLSAAQISPAGLMARYQSFFTPDFDLVDRP